ncbi:hypothetical protein ACPCSC_30590 [Streptomyces lavendulocolor]|uniref:hypothetical protein n=1 Tax=Streptomyces lavendulocolor TaxID=67316 RepID=UPI003C2C263E
MKQHFWQGMRVPYVTAWTAEARPQPVIKRIVGRGGEGIGYEDEHPVTDRRHEALWVRSGLAPGVGQPDFRRLNTHRQKRAMRYNLCQVCSAPAEGAGGDERTLHLLGATEPIAEGETTAAPPLHAQCAVESIENCRPLGRGWAAALVDYSPLWGVAGVVYDRVTLQPLPRPGRRPGELEHVHVGDERIRWTLASFTVISLHGVTAVSRDQLYEMAQAESRRARTAEPSGAA